MRANDFLNWVLKIKFLTGLLCIILSFILGKMALPVFPINSDTVPTIRFNEDFEKLIEEALREASEELSRRLGFNSTSY